MRTGKALPSLDEQRAAMASMGLDPDVERGSVFHDAAPNRRRDEPKWVQRDHALMALRTGDQLVVARPAVLATGLEDALAVLEQVSASGGTVYALATGRTYSGTSAADGLAFAREMEADNRALSMAKARAAATERRVTRRPEGQELAEWRRVYFDPKLTNKQVEARLGVPYRTLFNWFGARGTPRFGGPASKGEGKKAT